MKASTLETLEAYIETGRPTGDFLRAVLSNQLFEAFARADDENARDMHEIVAWIYNEAPSLCHGSPERYEAWLKWHADKRNKDKGEDENGKV